jgi:thioesterase domain-containing protein
MYSNIVKLKEGGRKKFFFIYDGDGEIMPYLHLSSKFPDEYTVYGIMPKTKPNIPQTNLSIEDMAKACLKDMKSIQPDGPYFLGGLCAGGVISFEIANQLESTNDEIGAIILIESVVENLKMKQTVNQERFSHLKSLLSAKDKSILEKISQSLAKIFNTVSYEITTKINQRSINKRLNILMNVLDADIGWPSNQNRLTFREIYDWAIKKHTFKTVFTSKVFLIRGTASVEGVSGDKPAIDIFEDECFGWNTLVENELNVIDVKGGHSSLLMQPYVEELSIKLNDKIFSSITNTG